MRKRLFIEELKRRLHVVGSTHDSFQDGDIADVEVAHGNASRPCVIQQVAHFLAHEESSKTLVVEIIQMRRGSRTGKRRKNVLF